MATKERFQTALKKGAIPIESGAAVPMTAQMKYDYLAAVHTMDQLLNLADEIKERSERREALREKISNSFKLSLKKFVDSEGIITLKQIDTAIKGLQECHNELAKIEYAAKESEVLAKFIEDGVSAGH